MASLWALGGTVLLVLLIIFLVLLTWKGLKIALIFALNAIVGFLALYLTRELLLPALEVNLVSVSITAVFGIIGYVLVVVLHLFGLWF